MLNPVTAHPSGLPVNNNPRQNTATVVLTIQPNDSNSKAYPNKVNTHKTARAATGIEIFATTDPGLISSHTAPKDIKDNNNKG